VSWPVGTVSELAEVISGYAFKSTWFGEGNSKVIRIGDLKNGRIDVENAACFDEKANPVKEQFKIREGDILMALSGATVGKIAVATVDTVGCYLNQRVAIVRSKSPESADYLKYVFSGSYLDKLLLSAGGAAQPNLSPKDLASMEIPLPPLEEQKRIAAILDKADSVRRKRQQAIDLADDFLRSVFLDMFGDPETKGWEITTVEKVAGSTKGSMRTGPFGSQLLHSEFVEKGIAVLGIDNAVENKFKWGKQRFITEEKYQQLKRYTVKPDDVIITIMGTCGRCAVVPEDIPTSINTKHICCITLDKDKCLSSFLHSYFLYHPDCQKYLATNTKGAIMAGLNMGIVKGIPVPLVPLSLQVKYDSIVRRLNVLSEGLSGHEEIGSLLFNSLSQKAFAGEL